MKVFYTDYNKKSFIEKLGSLFCNIGIFALVLGALLLLCSTPVNKKINFDLGPIAFICTMSGVFLSLFGMLFMSRIICSNERRRVFICDDKNDLYLLETQISDENIKSSDIENVTPKDLVFDMVDAMMYSKDKGKAANNFRDLKVVVDYLDSNSKAKIVDIKILKDIGKEMKILIQNSIGWKKELVVGHNYINYNELANIIREKSNK